MTLILYNIFTFGDEHQGQSQQITGGGGTMAGAIMNMGGANMTGVGSGAMRRANMTGGKGDQWDELA